MLSIVYFDGVWVMNGVGINGMPGELLTNTAKGISRMKKSVKRHINIF